MEIKRYLDEYKKYSPEDFFNWVSKGKPIEVRFLNDYKGNKFRNWDLIKHLSNLLKLEHRFNSLYINTFEELKTILFFKLGKYQLTRLYNIFIGVNPRRKVNVKFKNGLIKKSFYGGIAGTSHIQNILCDIEHVDKAITGATELMIEECIQGAKFLVKVMELKSFWINISGNGVHLWFDLDKEIELPIPSFKEFDTKLKYNLKEEPIHTYIKTYNRFIESINKRLQKFNPKLMVDEGAKDIARIARPVLSMNVKKGMTPRLVGTIYSLTDYNDNQIYKYNYNNYMAVKPVKPKIDKTIIKTIIKTNKHRYNSYSIRECPLYKLLVSEYLPSILSRNHYLEQNFARLIRDNAIKIEEIQDVIDEMSSVQNKELQVDPEYLNDDKPFNTETVNAWCFASKIPFIYEILEDIPFIENKVNLNWDKLGEVSINTLAREIKKPDNYFGLKTLIRDLVDSDIPMQEIFLTIKKVYLEDWKYYKSIVIDIINKTRRQKNV